MKRQGEQPGCGHRSQTRTMRDIERQREFIVWLAGQRQRLTESFASVEMAAQILRGNEDLLNAQERLVDALNALANGSATERLQ